MRRVGLPPGGSTFTTSAPRPASASPQYSACSSASSTTRMPVSGPRVIAAVAEAGRSSSAVIWALQSFRHRHATLVVIMCRAQVERSSGECRKEAARKAYQLFRANAHHPSLQFKKVHQHDPRRGGTALRGFWATTRSSVLDRYPRCVRPPFREPVGTLSSAERGVSAAARLARRRLDALVRRPLRQHAPLHLAERDGPTGGEVCSRPGDEI